MFTYAINLSGATINNNKFIDFLCEQLALHQIPAQAICFEITETVVTVNLAQIASKVLAIKELGFCFALDNFGSSMSSWGYLKNLSIDYLKINGTLIKNIVEEKFI
ncbi:MAG: EAL domain-containing protein [Calothrix sp. FI2-JRJ7]|nr:EAL domain-containing protein [Calothrix sp. FI2-JRJ7]